MKIDDILTKEDFRDRLNPFTPKDFYEETMSLGKEMVPKRMESVENLLTQIS